MTQLISDQVLKNYTLIDRQQINFKSLNLETTEKKGFRFYRIDEISEGKPQEYRQAMANVVANIKQSNSAMLYLLSGTPEGIKIYIGVSSNHVLVDEGQTLKTAFEGNFIGSKLTLIKNDDKEITDLLNKTKHIGLVTGVPSFNNHDTNTGDKDFQGLETLAKTLSDTNWQMLIVAEPGNEEEVRLSLDEVYRFSTELSQYTKLSIQQSENAGWSRTETFGTSNSETKGSSDSASNSKTKGTSESSEKGTKGTKGTNDSITESTTRGNSFSLTEGKNNSNSEGKSGGESTSLTRESINKRIEHIQNHLNDNLIPRHVLGLSKGMFKTAIYLCAENKNTYDRISASILSIYQGSEATLSPLYVNKLTFNKANLLDLFSIKQISNENKLVSKDSSIIHSTPSLNNNYLGATWLNTQELSLLIGLPSNELPGIKIRKSVSFAVNTEDEVNQENKLKLGKMIQDGRILIGKDVEISKDKLNKHLFVTGVTGSGKTTTCIKVLLESRLPFLVIEPAKTEYRALYSYVDDIQYYSLGREDLTIFRLNPFELISKNQNLSGHISMLKATMTSVFPMEASMPFIVEQAIIKSYENKGWDIASTTNYYVDDPWNTTEDIWPTFSDMITELDGVINSAGMGKEFEEKYRGSLVSRLTALTKGIKGSMINTSHSMDFNLLLENKVVIELEELKDEEDKAFFMALIISRIAECMKHKHKANHNFQHITLIEEAHRLLSKQTPGSDGSKALGVEMFANLLAEVRKYGESLIIADQIPNKLIPDVIKNTNIKIIHRLFASDDRDVIGDAIGLTKEQKDFLPLLQPGETVIYSGGWHAPVRAQIDQLANTNAKDINENEIAKIGHEQLWKQKEFLFPLLSRCQNFDNAKEFALFIYDAKEILNMLIKITKLYANNRNKEVSKNMAKKIFIRLQKKVNKLFSQLPLNINTSNMLVALLLDSLVPKWEIDSMDLLYELMPNILEKIQTSEDEFFLLFDGNVENKKFKRCFYDGAKALSSYNNI